MYENTDNKMIERLCFQSDLKYDLCKKMFKFNNISLHFGD